MQPDLPPGFLEKEILGKEAGIILAAAIGKAYVLKMASTAHSQSTC